MKNTNRITRILRIQSIDGFKVQCIFNNGETREIDFAELLNKWGITENDLEYKLLNQKIFKNLTLRNQTLSWPDVTIELTDIHGNKIMHPYELSPDMLYENSTLINPMPQYHFGAVIKEQRVKSGLTQQQLADLSGTSKTYISRIENDLIAPELSTLYKIVEVGLGKKVKVEIV